MIRNKEKYSNDIVNVSLKGGTIAFDMVKNKITLCKYCECDNCLFRQLDDEKTCTKNAKKWFDSEYIKPVVTYKLTENEVIELKYFKSIGAEKVFYNICHWSCHTSEDAYVDLKQNYQCLDNSKTYQIEEILNKREVVELAI